MPVRDDRPSEKVLGSRGRAGVIKALGPDRKRSISDVARTVGMSKSTISIAARSLEEAGFVRRTATGLALTPAGVQLAASMAGADGRRPDDLRPYAGQWVAVDANGRLVAAHADPRQLVAQLREKRPADARILRVPAGDEPDPA